ncbi:hypothetical protein ACO9S2_05625 [Nitrospira sp. NS4]|uniref:hypothetical protein n=1 Tax=Nitrospira sp. NS4 TaxID=3414498 RepID=UPI003C2F78A5
MTNRRVQAFGVIALLGMLVGGCASEGTTGSSYVPPQGIDRIAAGGVEDTLEACKARIPKDATAGQRMLAEQSCSRDQAARR